MKILYEKSFLRDLKKIKDQQVLDRINQVIKNVKSAETLNSISGIKKLKGHPSAYRIKMGDYRIGFMYENEYLVFIHCLNRKDIYRKFP